MKTFIMVIVGMTLLTSSGAFIHQMKARNYPNAVWAGGLIVWAVFLLTFFR